MAGTKFIVRLAVWLVALPYAFDTMQTICAPWLAATGVKVKVDEFVPVAEPLSDHA